MKKETWAACAICDDPNGLLGNHSHVTPSRFSLSLSMLPFLTEEESVKIQQAKIKELCGRCKNRLHQRIHRARRRSNGLPTHPPPMREWKAPR